MEELLKQVLGKVKAINGRLDNLDTGQASMQADITKIDDKIDKLELRVENEVIDKVRALYDACEVQQSINERIITTLGRIEAKVDVLQMDTANIRRVK